MWKIWILPFYNNESNDWDASLRGSRVAHYRVPPTIPRTGNCHFLHFIPEESKISYRWLLPNKVRVRNETQSPGSKVTPVTTEEWAISVGSPQGGGECGPAGLFSLRPSLHGSLRWWPLSLLWKLLARPPPRLESCGSGPGSLPPATHPAGGGKVFSSPGNGTANERPPWPSQWKATTLPAPSFLQWTLCLQ